MKTIAKASSTNTPLIHARALTYVGHAHSPWGAGHGRRKYQERKLPDGQVELVCGAGLDDVHKAAANTDNRFPWATLKSKRSNEARFVTCPECAQRIRAAGFRYAPPAPPTELAPSRRTTLDLGTFTKTQVEEYSTAKRNLAEAMQQWGKEHPDTPIELEFPPHANIIAHLAALPSDCMLNPAAHELVRYCSSMVPRATVLMFRSLVLGTPDPMLPGAP